MKSEKIDTSGGHVDPLPVCPACGARMLRWGWYESPDEPVRYGYCLECDLEGAVYSGDAEEGG